MKEIIIKKENEPEHKKSKWTIGHRILAGWTIVNLIIAIGIALYAIVSKWGNGTVALIWLFIIGAYIIVFAFIVLTCKKNNPKEFRHRLKDYLAGVKILTQLSNLTNLTISIVVVLSAFIKGDISSKASFITLFALLLFTVVNFIINIRMLVRRHKKRMREYY